MVRPQGQINAALICVPVNQSSGFLGINPTCGSRKGESLDSIADFGTMHNPWVYGSSNPFSARVAHILPSNAAVAAAGDCGSTPSALSLYQSKGRRPRIAPADRLLWSVVAKLWSGWRKALFFVQPRTVIIWQKRRFREYWRALSQPGRPQIS